MREFIRKYLLPIILSVALLTLLGLWVSYALLQLYSASKKDRVTHAVTMSRLVQSICEAHVLQGSLSAPRLQRVLSRLAGRTHIEHIQVVSEGRVLVVVNPDRDLSRIDMSRGSGHAFEGKSLVVWRTIRLQDVTGQDGQFDITQGKGLPLGNAPQKLVMCLDTKDTFKGGAAYADLLLIVLLIGFGGVVVLVLAWTYSNRNMALQEHLRLAQTRRDQVEELSLAATGLAHETKNPLGIIRGLAQQIADNTENSESAREMARDIMEEADVTTARLGDFLSYAKVRKPVLIPVSCPDIVQRVAGLLKEDFDGVGVELVVKVDNLPVIRADAEMFSQILMNLLMNSLKFCSAGGRVQVVTRALGGNKGMLLVIDDGAGIPSDILPNIFKPYITKRADGYGLGLAIVKRIVEQSGWDIDVQSSPDKGTQVMITNIEVCSGLED